MGMGRMLLGRFRRYLSVGKIGEKADISGNAAAFFLSLTIARRRRWCSLRPESYIHDLSI
jgi:hypothetical protein